MVAEVMTVDQEFSAEMEALVCEIVMGDRRHGLGEEVVTGRAGAASA